MELKLRKGTAFRTGTVCLIRDKAYILRLHRHKLDLLPCLSIRQCTVGSFRKFRTVCTYFNAVFLNASAGTVLARKIIYFIDRLCFRKFQSYGLGKSDLIIPPCGMPIGSRVSVYHVDSRSVSIFRCAAAVLCSICDLCPCKIDLRVGKQDHRCQRRAHTLDIFKHSVLQVRPCQPQDADSSCRHRSCEYYRIRTGSADIICCDLL